MKRALLLGLACTLLHSGMCLGQEKELPAPLDPPAVPEVIPNGGPAPPPECCDGTEFGCRPCGPRIWGGAEFLLWWTKRAPVNTPLVTSATNPADPTSGQIGSANTAVLLGNQSYDLNQRYGGRYTLGAWFDRDGVLGVEANYLYLAPRSTTQAVGTSGAPGSPTIGVPFFNPGAGVENFTDTGGNFGGTILPGSSVLRITNQLQGGELNMAVRLGRTENLNLTGLVGFRYVNFRENLDIGTSSTDPAIGASVARLDQFHANNNFYGGELGLRGEYTLGRFFIEATGKIALGSMNQTMDISGATTSVFPGAGPAGNFTNAPGGLFAQGTNSGHFSHNAFGVVPEVELKLGYNITRNVQAYAGYNFMYLNDVARPGTATDHSINPSQFGGGLLPGAPSPLVGPAAPTFSFNRSDFWAQGVTFGLQFKF